MISPVKCLPISSDSFINRLLCLDHIRSDSFTDSLEGHISSLQDSLSFAHRTIALSDHRFTIAYISVICIAVLIGISMIVWGSGSRKKSN